MTAMGSAFFHRRICLLGGGVIAVAAITMVPPLPRGWLQKRARPAAGCLRPTLGLRSALRRCICSTLILYCYNFFRP